VRKRPVHFAGEVFRVSEARGTEADRNRPAHPTRKPPQAVKHPPPPYRERPVWESCRHGGCCGGGPDRDCTPGSGRGWGTWTPKLKTATSKKVSQISVCRQKQCGTLVRQGNQEYKWVFMHQQVADAWPSSGSVLPTGEPAHPPVRTPETTSIGSLGQRRSLRSYFGLFLGVHATILLQVHISPGQSQPIQTIHPVSDGPGGRYHPLTFKTACQRRTPLLYTDFARSNTGRAQPTHAAGSHNNAGSYRYPTG